MYLREMANENQLYHVNLSHYTYGFGKLNLYTALYQAVIVHFNGIYVLFCAIFVYSLNRQNISRLINRAETSPSRN